MKYRTGKDNAAAADSLSYAFCASMTASNLMEILAAFVILELHDSYISSAQKLVFSTEEIRRLKKRINVIS